MQSQRSHKAFLRCSEIVELNAVEVLHLNIEKHQVWLQTKDGSESILSVLTISSA
jgi:hypothetical protein